MTIDPLKTIFTTDARLDDVTRARVWTLLAPRVTSPPRSRRRWPMMACAGIAAVAALAWFVLPRRPATAELVVPSDGALALPLGPATRAVVEGPGRLSVEREGAMTAVRLRAGTLYGEFTGGGGRSLRIEAAGATIEIVGTLFSVSVVGDTACLAVAHGRVRMTSAAVAVEVEGGQRACAVRGAPPGGVAAVDTMTLATISRYQRTWLADAAPSVAVVPAPVEPAPAAPAVTVEAVETPRPTAQIPRSQSPVEVAAVATEDVPATPAVDAADAGPRVSPADAAQPELSTPVDKALYRTADEAIARGDRATADRALSALLARVPESPLADEARYERARLAFERRDWAAVRERAADVQQGSPLREPAAYLGCRASREIGLAEARACLSDYLSAFPQAPHAVDALEQLVDIAFRTGGCDAVAAPLAELRAASPRAPTLETWQRRCGSP